MFFNLLSAVAAVCDRRNQGRAIFQSPRRLENRRSLLPTALIERRYNSWMTYETVSSAFDEGINQSNE
jgi:hypothetical protein